MLLEKEYFQKLGKEIKGVIHVGMHEAEEYSFYKELNIKNICFIEANRHLCDKIFNNKIINEDKQVKIIHAAIHEIAGLDVELSVTNNVQSSSLLKLKDHSKVYPHIVETEKIKMKTNTLDQVISILGEKENYNFLLLDIQGLELQAMKGLSDWSSIDLVYTEVNYREMYEGCALEPEITSFLKNKGFEKIKEVDTDCGWGDALYVRL